MNKFDKFKTIIIRGAKIYDFYETLKDTPGLPRDITDYLIGSDLDKTEKEEEIITFYSQKIAYKRITDFIKREFEIKKYDKKEFKQKTFRGSKIISVISFLEFEIQQCEKVIDLYSNSVLSFDKFALINYKNQLKIFYQVINLAIDGFINEKIKRDDFIGIWLKQNLKLEEE